MASKRRVGAENSETRSLLLDAAEQLMMEEGYAAITSRRLAAKAGLRSQLVHYYFSTMDELFFALMRRGSERMFKRQAEALASDQPLWALWDLWSDEPTARLSVEMLALASHRRPIAAEQGRVVEQARALQTAVLSRALRDYGLSPQLCPPVSVTVLIVILASGLGMEGTLGISTGHAETRALVEHFLEKFEGPRKQPRPPSRKSRRGSQATKT